jgi:hypothetical protein
MPLTRSGRARALPAALPDEVLLAHVLPVDSLERRARRGSFASLPAAPAEGRNARARATG